MAVKRRSAIATAVVLRVGEGRGFVVESRDISCSTGNMQGLVITAKHCLPHLPPPHPAMHLHEKTFKNLLGPLDGECAVSAECLFADPIADIAVLGMPDNQALSKQAEAYERLIGTGPALPIAAASQHKHRVRRPRFGKGHEVQSFRYAVPSRGRARALALDGHWQEYDVERWQGWLWLMFEQQFEPGMSGSPILNHGNAAIGVVSCDRMSPVIWDRLPAGLLRTLVKVKRQS